MKLSRTAAAGAGVILVGAMVVAGAGAAQADDFYIDATDIGVEGASYPDSWFIGNGAVGTHTFGPSGVTLASTSNSYLLLNGLTPSTGLVSLVDGASIDVVTGSTGFQIPVFFADDNDVDTNVEFTTLRSTVFAGNDVSSTGTWITSQPIISPTGTVLYAAETTATLAQFETAIGAGYEVLAFGAGVGQGTSATIASITWAGNTHWFIPAPTATVTPATVTTGNSDTTTLSFTATGFVPGDDVELYLSSGNSGGPVGVPNQIADANGAVTFSYQSATELPVGTYTLGALSDDSSVNVGTTLTVTANAAAAPAALPTTGVEPAAALAGGGLLLAAGVAFVVVSARRRVLARN